MRAVLRGLFQNNWQPQLQFIRNKTKINITRPRPPHYERALTEHVCHPYFLSERRPKHIPNFEACVKQVKVTIPEEDHPLKTMYANESLNWFKSSKLIAFFHVNAMNPEEKFQSELLMKKSGMKLLFFNKPVLNKALRNTKFENILGLYNAPTATAFSQQPDLFTLSNIIKKLPKLVLMAAMVENRLLSFSEVLTYGKFKNLDEVRALLLSTLSSTSQSVVQQLCHHPSGLVQILSELKKTLDS